MDSNNNIKSPRNNNTLQHNHPSLPSPRNSHSSSSSNSNNGTTLHNPPSPYPPKPITRSETGNPYPTTFVQADPTSFKQVVQMLTGSTETTKHVSSSTSNNNNNNNNNHQRNHNIPPIKTIPKNKNQGFKLYERRNSLKNLNLNPLLPVFSTNSNTFQSGFSPRTPDVLSPSILDFPALVLSPVTPLIPDPFNRNSVSNGGNGYRCGNGSPKPILNVEAEEKAIKEKGFFLHPSPGNTPRDSEPRLLPLFPTTSPRASGPSSSSSSNLNN